MPSLPDTTYTPFRISEKHFKNRALRGVYPTLHGQGVIDLSRPTRQEDDEVWRAGWWAREMGEEEARRFARWKGKGKARDPGERPATPTAVESDEGIRRIVLEGGKVGWVVSDGCVLVPQYLSPSKQLELLDACLSQYTLPPNPLSLSTHYSLPPDLFSLYATDSPDLTQPLRRSPPTDSALSHSSSASQSPDKAPNSGAFSRRSGRQTVETEAGSVLGYDEIIARNKSWKGDAPSENLGPKCAAELMRELRWANLGWVYQWSTKSYDFTRREPIVFPPELAQMCNRVVRDVPWGEVFERTRRAERPGQGEQQTRGEQSEQPLWSTWGDDYVPDTGIVNFYQMKDTLMGHVDRAELDPSRPLVSISLGHAAIFLLGSSSRHEPPSPIILRSGDVLIMSGKGRQAYHGIPRIMEGTLPVHFEADDGDNTVRRAAKRFIATARVNVNARQVFPPGFRRPDRHDDSDA